VAEELRFFLRTAAYTVVIAVVYWFLSYETAGTVMLIFVSFSTGVVVSIFFFAVRATRGQLDPHAGGPLHRAGMSVARVVGFAEPTREANEEPLAAGLEPIPTGSIWPLVAGIGATLLGLGLVYGPWLLLPGIAVAVLTVWGWLTQMDAR
jgi:Cytochrome c oxidase subunit IV